MKALTNTNKLVTVIAVLLCSFDSVAAKFPHKTAMFTMQTSLPMGVGSINAEHYISFAGKNSVSAEWTSHTTMGRTKKSFNLVKAGFSYHIDLDSGRCTKTDVSQIQDKVDDPEKLGEHLKQQMGLKADGNCEGSGYKGTRYTSSFGQICLYEEVFMLWTEAMGSRTEATNIVFDKPLPKEKISLPAGVECVESNFSGNPQDTNLSESSPADMQKAMEEAKKMLEGFGGSWQN